VADSLTHDCRPHEPAVEVRGLVKHYRVIQRPRRPGFWEETMSALFRPRVTKVALEGVDFTIRGGEVVGFVGPNGAGKTTTIKCLTGVLRPNSGHVRVLGYDPQRQRYAYTYNIGLVMGQKSLLQYDLPVFDSLRLYRDIYEVPRREFERRVREFSDILGLDEFGHIPVRQLSLGQRMRAEIASSLLHSPRVVFLDEPTLGLDILAKGRIHDFLRELNRRRGTTVFLTTHDIRDVERLCTRVIVIDRGRIVRDGAISDLKAAQETRTATFRLRQGSEEGLRLAARVFGPEMQVAAGPAGEVRVVGMIEQVKHLVRLLLEREDVVDVSLEPPSLEDILTRIYSDGAGDPYNTREGIER